MSERHLLIAGLHAVVATDDDALVRHVADRYGPFARSEAAAASVPVAFSLAIGPRFEPMADAVELTRMEPDVSIVTYERGAAGWSVTHRSLADETDIMAQMEVAAGDAPVAARCWLSGDVDLRTYSFNNFMMQLFAFASMTRRTALFHASVVEQGGRAYLFLGKSGTGKSTHSRLWMENIAGVTLVNDDNPAVSIGPDGRAIVHGTPWSGKTPCYRDVAYPIGALVRIRQAPHNVISRQRGVAAYAAILPSSSAMRWEAARYRALSDTLARVAADVPIYVLDCLPDAEAARICHSCVST